MKKLLITGGAGYIGSALIPKLIERGYKIDVVDLFWFGDYLPEDVTRIKKDIFSLVEEDIEQYDTVIFLAGLSNDPMAEYSPSKNFIYNAAAPSYLSYICKRAGIKRFIYASSCSVYGYTLDRPFDEDKPTISAYPYGISKLQGEQAVFKMTGDGMSVICLRKGTVSGYSPRMRLDLIVNAMFKSAVQNKLIVVNNPSIWRPILSIKDAISAYIRAIEASEDVSGIFNIASGNFTVGEVADIVRAELEEKLHLDIGIEIKHIPDMRNYKVTINKAKELLSFSPRHTVESIVEDLIVNMDKFSDFDNPKYYNIKTFKAIIGK